MGAAQEFGPVDRAAVEQFAFRHSLIESGDMEAAPSSPIEETTIVSRSDQRRSVGVKVVAGFQNSHNRFEDWKKLFSKYIAFFSYFIVL